MVLVATELAEDIALGVDALLFARAQTEGVQLPLLKFLAALQGRLDGRLQLLGPLLQLDALVVEAHLLGDRDVLVQLGLDGILIGQQALLVRSEDLLLLEVGDLRFEGGALLLRLGQLLRGEQLGFQGSLLLA
ncbi:hypothetical protein FQZ97_973170 [compost metagenome]